MLKIQNRKLPEWIQWKERTDQTCGTFRPLIEIISSISYHKIYPYNITSMQGRREGGVCHSALRDGPASTR